MIAEKPTGHKDQHKENTDKKYNRQKTSGQGTSKRRWYASRG